MLRGCGLLETSKPFTSVLAAPLSVEVLDRASWHVVVLETTSVEKCRVAAASFR